MFTKANSKKELLRRQTDNQLSIWLGSHVHTGPVSLHNFLQLSGPLCVCVCVCETPGHTYIGQHRHIHTHTQHTHKSLEPSYMYIRTQMHTQMGWSVMVCVPVPVCLQVPCTCVFMHVLCSCIAMLSMSFEPRLHILHLANVSLWASVKKYFDSLTRCDSIHRQFLPFWKLVKTSFCFCFLFFSIFIFHRPS